MTLPLAPMGCNSIIGGISVCGVGGWRCASCIALWVEANGIEPDLRACRILDAELALAKSLTKPTIRVPCVNGGIYDAGRGGTEALRYYVLRRRQNGDVVRDFGPAATITSLDQWHADASRDGHTLASVRGDGHLFLQCPRCGVTSLTSVIGSLHPSHGCPETADYDPRAYWP